MIALKQGQCLAWAMEKAKCSFFGEVERTIELGMDRLNGACF